MKKLLLGLIVSASTFALAQTGSLPANPQPGKCYVKCVTHDEFKTEEVRIMTSPAYKKIKTVPATYKTVTEKVLIKEASKKLIYHPAEYTTEKISYVKKADASALKAKPAELTNATETIEIFPKTAEWEYTSYSECTSPNPEDCQTLCYVEKPAQYQTIAVKRLASDASTASNKVAGSTTTYNKQVVSKAAYVEEVVIPAVYGTITRQVVDVPAKEIATEVPATFKTITKEVLVKKGGVKSWQEIDCDLVQAQELNIQWNSGSSTLTYAAKQEINRVLLPLLQGNSNMNIELSSHTDSQGSKAFNTALSQRRADAVKSYLISKGISSSRLVSKGYGETKLKNNCSDGVSCTAAQHAKNRRTEYRVINQ